MRRGVFVVGIVALVAGAVAGSAASLPTSSSRLGEGGAVVAACGSTAGASVTYAQSAGNVTGLTVSGLPSSCNGGVLTVTLTQGGTALRTGSQTVAGGAATVAVSAVAASSVSDARVVVVGP